MKTHIELCNEMTIDEYIMQELLKQKDECLRIINSKYHYTDEDRNDSRNELRHVKEAIKEELKRQLA